MHACGFTRMLAPRYVHIGMHRDCRMHICINEVVGLHEHMRIQIYVCMQVCVFTCMDYV